MAHRCERDDEDDGERDQGKHVLTRAPDRVNLPVYNTTIHHTHKITYRYRVYRCISGKGIYLGLSV